MNCKLNKDARPAGARAFGGNHRSGGNLLVFEFLTLPSASESDIGGNAKSGKSCHHVMHMTSFNRIHIAILITTGGSFNHRNHSQLPRHIHLH